MTTNVEKKDLAVQEKVYYDQSDMQGEMMRYRANSSSYKFGMLAIIFSVLASFISLNSIKWTTFDVIVKILGNIVILLFGFLSVEKVKAYNKSYSYVLMAFGGICVGRIFWFPLMLITDYAAYLNNNLDTGRLGATVIGDPMAHSYLPQSGYVRAIIAIVFLSLSAVSFIISGVIAYKKSVRYHKYMQGKDVSKGV